MIRNRPHTFTCILVVVCVLSTAQAGAVASSRSNGTREEAVVTSHKGIKYNIKVKEGDNVVIVKSKNPTNNEVKFTGYVLRTDGQRIHSVDFNLSAGEQRTKRINITPGINVNQDHHTVTFSTFGNHTEFNFTRRIDSVNSTVPTPYIENVTVTTGTVEGEPSAVANVTVVNPSKQLYSTKLFVHTEGTDGSLYPASVRPGDSRTITVELLDDRGSKIAGEARLYTGNLTTSDGAMDEVEFAGKAGEGTRVWNVTYEPARPTWMNDHYQYHNDSYEQSVGEKVSGGHEVGGIPLVYPVGALLVGWLGLRKFR